MTYLELINRFWRIFDKEPFTPTEVALYMFLLNECNKQRWPTPFEISNRRVCLGLDISEATMIRARRVLQERQVLDFMGGHKKKSSPLYYFNFNFKNESKNKSKNKSKNESKNESIYIEDIKDIKDIALTSYNAREENAVFFERFFAEQNMANLEVVLKQFRLPPGKEGLEKLCVMANDVIAEWQLAEMKHRDYNDWARHLTSTMRIKCRAEQEEQESQANGNERHKIQTDRRGTEADSKKQKAWEATF